MAKVFSIQDMSGRIIYCSHERWNHIQKHPGMSGSIDRIIDTLINPNKILSFEFDSDVHFYYLYFKDKREYIMVSVKYLNGEGYVITSFYTDAIK